MEEDLIDTELLLGELGMDEGYFIDRGLVKYTDAGVGEMNINLVVVKKDSDGREHELLAGAAEAWKKMRDAAYADGIELLLVSAYRSIQRQAEIIRAKLLRGLKANEIFSVSAPPGFSEHHTGRAVDISTPGFIALEEEFERSDAFRWLTNHAGEFGFSMTYGRGNSYGFLYEPWHWVWEGEGSLS